jgi:hypothetical protein
MSDPDPQDAFFLSLEEIPGDRVTLLALADWYEEQDQHDCADCLRWTVRHGHYPFRAVRAGLKKFGHEWHEGWYWWAIDDPYSGESWGHPRHCQLPPEVWRQLQHTIPYVPAVMKEYPTQRAAYEALFEAWPRVPLREADVGTWEKRS